MSSAGSTESAGPSSSRTLSLATLYLVGLGMNLEFAMLMPTAWNYVQSLGGNQFLLGIVISSFSIARVLSFVFIGWWSDKRGFREPMFVSFILGIIGNFLYGFAGKFYEYVGSGGIFLLILGRIITGVGSSNITLTTTYLNRVCTEQEKTRSLASIQGVQLLGIAVGPALNLIFTHASLDLGFFVLNDLTAAGYAMMLVNIFILVFAIFFFQEPEPEQYSRIQDESKPLLGAGENSSTWEEVFNVLADVGFIRGGIAIWIIRFMVSFEISCLETSFTPMTQAQYNWKELENSIAFSIFAVVIFLGVVLTIILNKKGVNSKNLIVLGFALFMVYFIIIFPFGYGHRVHLAGTIAATPFFLMALPITTSASISVYTRMLPKDKAGALLGFGDVIMSLGRIVGPLLAGVALKVSDQYWPLFLTLFLVFALSLLVFARYHKILTMFNEARSDSIVITPQRDSADSQPTKLNEATAHV